MSDLYEEIHLEGRGDFVMPYTRAIKVTGCLGDHRPASTTVEVTRLAADPRLVLELRAVAVAP